MRKFLLAVATLFSLTAKAQLIESYKITVDSTITYKTGPKSITPYAVGSRFKELADILLIYSDSAQDRMDTLEAMIAEAGGSPEWDNIQNKPSTFAPSAHTQAISTITGLQTALDAKLESVDWADVTSKPTTFPPEVHTHTFGSLTSKPTTLSGFGITDAVVNTTTVNGHALSSNVTVTATDLSLGNVDNTSDVNKPVSTAQQTAIDAKIADAINNGTTTIAPSQNAVFDALALKFDIPSGTATDGYVVTSVSGVPTWQEASGGGGSGSITSSGYTQSTARLLGRTTASTGAIEEISVLSSLQLTAGFLQLNGANANIFTAAQTVRGTPATSTLGSAVRLFLQNNGFPNSGAPEQYSPSFQYRANSWDVNDAVSRVLDFYTQVKTVSSNTPRSYLSFSSVYNTTTPNEDILNIHDDGSATMGTTTPDSKAILNLVSTTKGVLFPRMTTTQKNAISSPTEGLTVYDLTLHKLYVYDGTTWLAAW